MPERCGAREWVWCAANTGDTSGATDTIDMQTRDATLLYHHHHHHYQIQTHGLTCEWCDAGGEGSGESGSKQPVKSHSRVAISRTSVQPLVSLTTTCRIKARHVRTEPMLAAHLVVPMARRAGPSSPCN